VDKRKPPSALPHDARATRTGERYGSRAILIVNEAPSDVSVPFDGSRLRPNEIIWFDFIDENEKNKRKTPFGERAGGLRERLFKTATGEPTVREIVLTCATYARRRSFSKQTNILNIILFDRPFLE